MGRNKKKRRAEARDASSAERAPAAPSPNATGAWGASKGPALRFVLISAALMLLFYGVFYTSPEESPALDAFIRGYLGAYASAAAVVLDLFGLDASARGTTLFLGTRAVEIITPLNEPERGCQLSLFVKSPDGKQLFEKMTERGLIADWREPNVIRIAPTPMYNTFEELGLFIQLLEAVIDESK
jgi:hypothetical protein